MRLSGFPFPNFSLLRRSALLLLLLIPRACYCLETCESGNIIFEQKMSHFRPFLGMIFDN